ncbi:MAG: AAA family ATPase [Snowella sp.]|nr:AAA family ATPase [Snowella sp.]
MDSDLDSCVYIHGLGISSYRSFPKDIQRIYPFKKINLFIGRNNSGKSNILNFLYKHYLSIFRDEEIKFKDFDYHNFALFQKNDIKTEFYFYARKGWKEELINKFKPHNETLPKILELIKLFENKNSYFWLVNHQRSIGSHFEFSNLEMNNFETIVSSDTQVIQHPLNVLYDRIKYKKLEFELEGWKSLNKITKKIALQPTIEKFNPSLFDHPISQAQENERREKENKVLYLKEILGYICDFILDYSGHFENYFKEDFAISLIPAIREIGNPGTTFDEKKEFNGQGLIDGLLKLQQPDYSEQHKKEQFNKINQFLRTVTDNESAKIEIPHDKSKILVEMDGKILPLQSLGTGIHEVIILAAAATIKENQVICMEEPELHLHPLLQKKLISYLQEKTNNQYFITTHSAHFLDTPDVSIFHVNYENGCSIVKRVETDNHKTTVLSDLGYKPSDLLQTNCVIWVEGPSDRIYLNYWIQCFSPELKEKIHYTIMFYGGGLLSHLSVSNSEDKNDSDLEDLEDLNDFISLLKINRNTVIMCDSDKSNKNDSLKPAIKRIKSEFENTEFEGFHWITDGREVENYLAPDIVETIIKENHRNVDKISGKKIYSYFWKYKSSKVKKNPTADKVKLARKLIESYPVSKENFEKITNSALEGSLKKWIEKLINSSSRQVCGYERISLSAS